MRAQLSPADRQFLTQLLAWDKERRALELRLRDMALITGGVFIFAAALFTIRHLTDAVVVTVLVPGFGLGALFVAAYLLLNRRVTARHRMARLVKALMDRRDQDLGQGSAPAGGAAAD